MATPPILEATRCLTIFIVDKQHSRFEVYQINRLLDTLAAEKKAEFKSLTRKPLSQILRRTPWRGMFDPRHPTTFKLFYVFNRIEECKFKINKSYVK
jgi:hypothetical protein